MTEIKYRAGSDPFDKDMLFDSIPAALKNQGWEKRGNLWWQRDDTQGSTLEEAIDWESIVEVRPFRIGTSGTIRVEHEEDFWGTSEEEALTVARRLPEDLTVLDMTLEAPDSSDFNPWIKEMK